MKGYCKLDDSIKIRFLKWNVKCKTWNVYEIAKVSDYVLEQINFDDPLEK